MYRLMIVEDDAGISSAVRKLAEAWDFEVRETEDFKNVLREFADFQPHLVLMDIALPFFSGYYWCGEIRKISSVPMIFISSASDNMNVVMAINMGADDFIAKPFDGSVLMAKVQALLRRAYNYAPVSNVIEHKGAILNVENASLTYQGKKVSLSKNEFRILQYLLEKKGQVVSREKLMERLWETDEFVDENTLTVNVNRLRRKLDAAGLNGWIVTRFGVGYMVEV